MVDKLKNLWYNLKSKYDSTLIAWGWKKKPDPVKERMDRYVQQLNKEPKYEDTLAGANQTKQVLEDFNERRRIIMQKIRDEEELRRKLEKDILP